MINGCKEYLGQPISCDFHRKLGSKDVAKQICMERGKPLFTVLSAKFKMFFQDYSLLLTEMIIKEDLLQKGRSCIIPNFTFGDKSILESEQVIPHKM